MPNLGVSELIIILIIVVLLFGTRKLPELGKGLGSGIRNFKSAMNGSQQEELPEAKKSEQLHDGSPSSSRTSFGNQ